MKVFRASKCIPGVERRKRRFRSKLGTEMAALGHFSARSDTSIRIQLRHTPLRGGALRKSVIRRSRRSTTPRVCHKNRQIVTAISKYYYWVTIRAFEFAPSASNHRLTSASVQFSRGSSSWTRNTNEIMFRIATCSSEIASVVSGNVAIGKFEPRHGDNLDCRLVNQNRMRNQNARATAKGLFLYGLARPWRIRARGGQVHPKTSTIRPRVHPMQSGPSQWSRFNVTRIRTTLSFGPSTRVT